MTTPHRMNATGSLMTEPQPNLPDELLPESAPFLEDVLPPAGEPQPELADNFDGNPPEPVVTLPAAARKRLPVWLIVLLAALVLAGGGFGVLRLLERSALDQAAARLDGGDFSAAEQAASRALALPFKTLQAEPSRAYLLRGQALFHQGQLDAALADLLAAEQTYPQDVALQSALAQIYLAKGELEQAYAAGALVKAADDGLALPYALDALKAYQAYQWDDALSAANTALERGDDSGLALRIRGALALWREEFDAAAAALEQAATLAPQDIEAHALRVYLYSELSRPAEANAALEQVTALSTDSAVSLWAQGLVKWLHDDNQAALDLARRALALEERPEFYLLSAVANELDSIEARQRVEDDLEQSLALMPDFYPALVTQTRFRLIEYQLEDFEAVRLKLKELAPSAYSTPSLRCLYHMRLYNFFAAEPFCKEMLELAPNIPVAHSQMAILHLARYEFDEAWQEIDTALKLNPDNAATLLVAYYGADARDDDEKAMQYLEQALKIDPDSADILAYKAVLLQETGENDEAGKVLNRAFEIDPNSIGALQARIQISLANEDTLTALNDANQLIKLQPKNPNHYLSRAWVYLSSGNFNKARQDANTALGMEERLPDGRAMLAAIYDQEGKMASAIMNAEKSLDILPYQTQAYLVMMSAQAKLKRMDESIAAIEKASALEPWNDDVQLALASAYLQAGKFEQAVPVLEAQLEQNDDLSLDALELVEAMLAFAKSIAPVENGMRTQVDDASQFSITTPADWIPLNPATAEAGSETLQWAATKAGREDLAEIKLYVIESEGLSKGSPSLFANAFRQQLAQDPSFQLFGTQSFRAGSLLGATNDYQLEQQFEDGSVLTFRSKTYFFLKGDRLYVIELTATPYSFERLIGEVDQIISTFRILE